ncbi:MAG: hypothetical protein U1F30_17155, partial [Steroidobacteraceae bacterium]
KVGVTVLCPGPVSSKLGSSQRNRPGHLAGSALVDVDLESTEAGRGLHWLDPDAVAELLLRAVRRGDLYAFTHPEWASIVQERHARIAAAFAAVSDAGAPGDTGK